MKKSLIILICSLMALNVNAQLKHYIGLNFNMNYRFLNINESKTQYLNPIKTLNKFIPYNLSYRIEKEKNGLELYSYIIGIHDLGLDERYYKVGNYSLISYMSFGVNYSRLLLSESFLDVRVFAGINRNYMYHEQYELFFYDDNGEIYEEFYTGGYENNWGLQGGVNATATVWKGLFINGNIRYTNNPFSKYRDFRHLLACELGLGYKIQRKKR